MWFGMFRIFWINLIDVLCILCSNIFISLIIAGQVAAAEGSSAEEPRKHARFHVSCFTTFPEVGVWSVRSCTLGRELKIGDPVQLRFPLFSGMWVDSNGTFRGRECLSMLFPFFCHHLCFRMELYFIDLIETPGALQWHCLAFRPRFRNEFLPGMWLFELSSFCQWCGKLSLILFNLSWMEGWWMIFPEGPRRV